MTDDELVERMFAVYHTPGKTAGDVLALLSLSLSGNYCKI